ncbi:MAG: tRNA CCA-pyrophosphorylase [Methanobacteriota archaeon]|nr:MAG: tRNA CCA-pyrophosphorylase [Euryarchaeota archaeon]
MQITDRLVQYGFELHGHKCPAMPLGLKTAKVAMDTLGVTKSQAGELFALLELGDNHCAGCFADGVQMMAGTTLGKGNIAKTYKGKFGLILIDRKTGRAARVVPKGEILLKALNSEFMKLRKAGNPPQDVPWEVTRPLIEKVLGMPPQDQFDVEVIEGIEVSIPKHQYEKGLCESCGEVVVKKYATVIDDKYLCRDCAEGRTDEYYNNGEVRIVKKK